MLTFLSERLKAPKEDEDNAFAKLFACVGGQETRKQSVVWEMSKCESAIVDGASDNLNWENKQATLEIIITGTV